MSGEKAPLGQLPKAEIDQVACNAEMLGDVLKGAMRFGIMWQGLR